MKQVWHIFQKDARHFWREIAVSIVVMSAFAWNEARVWLREDELIGAGNFFSLLTYQFLPGLLVALVPISWSFLTVRAIQDESLVGDRQFWITRPYQWKNLLAAKALFVLAFVNLPLLIADVYLLTKAGFAPVACISGLLWMQLLLLLFLFLPFAALATVTATVVQMLVAVLAVILYLIGTAALSSVIPGSSLSSGTEPLQAAIFFVIPVAVVVWQYARRKTAKSRWLLSGAAACILLMVVVTPYAALVAREYPQFETSEQPPLHLQLHPLDMPVTKDEPSYGDNATIDLSLDVSGIAPESIIEVNGILVTIDSSNGLRWNSGWTSSYLTIFPSQHRTELTFPVKKTLYDRERLLSVNARVSLALTVYHDQNRREFVIPNGEFVLPDAGRCIVRPRYGNSLQCLAPLRRPSSLLIRTDISQTTCPITTAIEPLAPPGTMAHQWFSWSDSGPADFGISSVKPFNIYTVIDDGYGNAGRAMRGICAGTPLILSNPKPVEKRRMDLEFPAIRLLDHHRGMSG